MTKLSGKCKWFDRRKGHGFVTSETGEDYFVHHSGISTEGFRALYKDQPVEFELGDDSQGRKHAIKVTGPGGETLVRTTQPATRRAPKERTAANPSTRTDGGAGTGAGTGEKRRKRTKKPSTRTRRPQVARTVHWVIRNSDLKPTVEFLKQVFGMRVLRHEENAEPCKITCNGRYNNAWSKTMVGFESEDKAYCLEVTYNYGVLSYKPGTGLCHIAIGVENVDEAVAKAKALGYTVDAENVITGPDNYKYAVVPKVRREAFDHVKLRVANVENALKFYTETLGMSDFTARFKVNTAGCTKHAVVGFAMGMVPLFIFEDGNKVDIQQFEGRHAISMSEQRIKEIYAALDPAHVVHKLQELQENLGKLVITIIKDVDGYEHCLVNTELFDKAAAANTDFKEPDWDVRRKFIDERAGKNKGKSS